MFCVFSATDALADTIDAWSPASSGISVNNPNAPIDLGTLFTSNVNGSVTALGIYAGNNATYVNAETVGLYDSTGTLLASTTVTDTGYLYDNYYWSYLITPVSVVAGDVYTVVDFTNGNGFAYGLSYVSHWATLPSPYDDYAVQSGHLKFPTSTGPANVTYYGGNVLLDENPPPVPEPGSLILFGSGLLGMAGVLRRKLIKG
jgi:hypothetical protein